MKLKSVFNALFLFFPFLFHGQDQLKFVASPYFNGITNVKDGFVEVGAEFNKNFKEGGGKKIRIAPFVRLPITNKQKNLVVIDRYTSSAKAILSFDYELDNTQADGPVSFFQWGGQVEFGNETFIYYPTGDESQPSKENHNSYSGEIRLSVFKTKGQSFAPQTNVQLRIRASNDYNASDEIQVINASTTIGVGTISNLVVEAPYKIPFFSPALLFQKYPGKGSFSYTTALYYDIAGRLNQSDPFNNIQRPRLEYWIFYYPKISDHPNVKIGVGPYVSYRVKGSDVYNQWEKGAQLTVKLNSSFLRFF